MEAGLAGSSNDPKDGTLGSTGTLERIARALGEPETAFSEGTASRTDIADTCEMLRIWQGLERVADRRKVLAFARSLTEQE